MGMTLLENLRGLAAVQRLRGLDSTQVKNAFFANYLAGVVILKMQDMKGLALINDRSNASLSAFKPGMTDVTFWGRALFHSNDEAVKKSLLPGHAELLKAETGRILDSRIKKLINVLMTPPAQVDWQELIASLVILKHRLEMNSSYYNKVVLSLSRWESLSSSARKNVLSTVYTYLVQADPKSALTSRIRELSGSSLLGDLKAAASRLVSVKLIKEDGDGGGCDVGVSTGDIASGLGAGNAIVKRFDSSNDLSGLFKLKGKSPMQLGDKSVDKDKKKSTKKMRARNFKLVKFKDPNKS